MAVYTPLSYNPIKRKVYKEVLSGYNMVIKNTKTKNTKTATATTIFYIDRAVNSTPHKLNTEKLKKW